MSFSRKGKITFCSNAGKPIILARYSFGFFHLRTLMGKPFLSCLEEREGGVAARLLPPAASSAAPGCPGARQGAVQGTESRGVQEAALEPPPPLPTGNHCLILCCETKQKRASCLQIQVKISCD